MSKEENTANQEKHGIVFKLFFLIGVMAVIVIGGHYAIRSITKQILYESTDDAFVDGHIVSISPKVGGIISQVLVQDNQDVKKGDLLLTIDPCDYQTKVKTYQAALQVARAEAEKAKSNISVSQAQADFTQNDLKRYEELSGGSSISRQNLDAARTAAVSAKAALDAAVKSSASSEARIAQAQADLEQAELSLSYTKIYSPRDGRIAQKHAEVGSFTAAGSPLMAIIAYDVWVVANFKETQLDVIHTGQKVTIYPDAYSKQKLTGHVNSIQAGTGSKFSLFPPENATGNYVKIIQRVPVKITFDEPAEQLKYLGLGMSVVPIIYVAGPQSRHSWWLKTLEYLGSVDIGKDGEGNQ
jgi:membrane fusion protein, multidrug efflux system